MEQVNNFEFNNGSKGTAIVNIKVGNVVAELSFRTNYEGEIAINIPENIQTLIDAGVEMDFDELKKEYAKLRDEKEEEENQKKRKEAAEKYDASWVHDVDQIDGVTYNIESNEDYLDRVLSSHRFNSAIPRFYAQYKDNEVEIKRVDVGDRWNENIKFQIWHKLTGHNRRNYASPENAINKIVKLVDKKERKAKEKKERLEREKQERKEKLERLSEIFGKMKLTRSYVKRGRYEYKYYIVRGENEYRVIQKWNDDNLFKFGSFSWITADQVNDIIEILEN